MTNDEIQLKAFNKVRRYERKFGRNIRVHKTDGYDLISLRNEKIVRHIEVKGTTKSRLSFRWFEENEFHTLLKDRIFYLYIVTGVGTRLMNVYEFSQKETLLHYNRIVNKFYFTFAKEDFE